MPTNAPLVLVVDDNFAMRELATVMLVHAGYRAVTAEGGAEVMQRVSEYHPDLILLDLMMPDVDGFAVLRQLRAEPSTRSIPVVVLSAADGDLGRRAVERFGADAFWGKQDINLLTFRDRLEAVMHAKHVTTPN